MCDCVNLTSLLCNRRALLQDTEHCTDYTLLNSVLRNERTLASNACEVLPKFMVYELELWNVGNLSGFGLCL